MLTGIIDFYHLIPLSLTLTLPESQAQREAQSIDFILSHTFNLIRVKIVVLREPFNVKVQSLILTKIFLTQGNCFTHYVKKL